MKHRAVVCAFLVGCVPAAGHDMFLVVEDHFVPPESEVEVSLYNGTFDKSENAIDRERMIEVSLVDGVGEVSHPAAEQWRDDNNISILRVATGDPGTNVLGVSTKTRMIELSAEEFNEYLAHDGVLDVLETRKAEKTLDRPANERYSKHVKTILQIGETLTDSYSMLLGFPLEIVPQSNPSGLRPGDSLRVLIMAEGSPAADQLVYASYAGFPSHDETGGHQEAARTRTNDHGVAEFEITRSGRWYVRLIRMLPVDEDGVDYESNWATLTFEVK